MDLLEGKGGERLINAPMGAGGAPPQEQREELLALNMKQRASLPTDFCNIRLAVSLFYLTAYFLRGNLLQGYLFPFSTLK